MKKTALAVLLATTVVLAPWHAAFAANTESFLHGQRLYALGDYGGALTAWRPLAQEGDVRAQYSMAVLYLKGRGVPRDQSKAREWAGRAAAQGYKPAQRLVQRLQQTAAKAQTKTKAVPKSVANSTMKPKRRKPKSQMTEMERIETAVEDLLRQIAGRVARNGALEYGDPRAIQLANAIQVTIPDIVIHGGAGDIFDIGTVVAHVRRQDERFDNITLALPGNVRIRKADGTGGRITIAKRLAKLRWDRQLKTSTEFEFRLSDLVFQLETGGEMGRVGEVLAQADILEKKGLWTGPMRFSLTNVNMTDGVESTFRLGQFSLALDLRALNLPALNENESQGKTAGGSNGGAGMPPLKMILGLAKGVGLQFKINDLAVQHPIQGNLKLDQAAYGLDLSSDDGTLLNLELTTSHHGLNGTGGPAAQGLVPQDLDIVLALENLPSDTVVNVGVAAGIERAVLGKMSSGPQGVDRLRPGFVAARPVRQVKRASITP
ncbi:MAG: sel1 repeat family protein, partial [Alphaproteobacteria bacterium]|nr:sel1 repeat family protein [Alphaproteobacteria bacterium]